MKTSKDDSFKILIVAAEASSSLYAQRLLEDWKAKGIKVDAFGIGSKKMESLGFRCLGYAEDLAVVGLVEVLKHFGKIYQVFYALLNEAEKIKPDLVLLLDYPDFNFRLAKKLKKKKFPIYYYISPQIWAWRQNRVYFIKKYIDKMLVLFPFEVDFYKKFGVDVEFVGHPLLDELRPELFDSNYIGSMREKFGVQKNHKILGLMPGSRQSELTHHLESQLKIAEELQKQVPDLKVMLFVAPNLNLESVRARVSNWNFPIQFVQRDPFEMVAMSDIILCASGTATLTVGLMEKPMAIMYKMKPSTVFLARFVMKMPKFFGLVNLIQNKLVSKEFFQEDANPEKVVPYLKELLVNSSTYQKQVEELRNLKMLLGSKGATKKVSEIILEKK